MKIAVSSASFSPALRRGDLTHLEWLEACASRLDVDGVVLALADFPRTDSEYVAQVKKVTTDLGLVPVALDVPGLLDPERTADAAAALAAAAAAGCALLRVTAGRAGELPPETFARTVAATKSVASLAKSANITLCVAPAAGSLLGDLSAVQNFVKYVDSAWLRYDVALDDPERGELGARDRVLIERIDFAFAAPSQRARITPRAWLLLEGDGGDDPFARAAAALAALREKVGQQPQMPSVVPG